MSISVIARSIAGAAVTLLLAAALAPIRAQDADAKPAPESTEALEELRAAGRLLGNARTREQGIEKLQEIVRKYPEDAAAAKAKAALRQHGVGDKVRVTLNDREVFTKRFGYTEESILEMGERTLDEILREFKGIEPFYRTTRLALLFHDSQARYRKATGNITTSGDFSAKRHSDARRFLEGEIEWFLPQQNVSAKDRMTRTQSLLYHEIGHFANAVYFARKLPSVFDEGLAEYYQSRLHGTYYEASRYTDREQTESDARNGLAAIARYEDFVAFLDSPRAWGKGDQMINRWYGLCYAVIDLFEEGEIDGKRSSVRSLLPELSKRTLETIDPSSEGHGKPLTARALLEAVAREIYACDLETFHKALVRHITTKHKQR